MNQNVNPNDFAVIGMALRLPDAGNAEKFWQNLLERRDCVSTLPLSRIKLHPTYDPIKEYAPYGYLEGIDEFDPVFFKVAPNAAAQIDPCHRLLLEVVNDAIEDAGYCREQMKTSKVGVFLGNYYPEYFKYVTSEGLDRLVGNLPANFAGRLAYLNGFTGPALTMDTACSSTLVALHMAIQSLKNDDCEIAVVGGANLRIDLPLKQIDQIGITSPTGKCRSFSDAADGVAGGEGVIAVLVKPLMKALADHDHVYAVVKGSAVNQDGDRSNGITAPSPEAQKEVLQTAWKKAGIDPRTISYIETHGSATKLGDPVEIAGITKAFREYTEETQFCPIGAVKTNIGHLDSVAGLAGFVKTVLALQHKQIPPTVHFERPNPYIDLANSPVYVTTTVREWNVPEGTPRRAGVSSFGLSGTNCHVVLEEAPTLTRPASVERSHLFALSGPDERTLAQRIQDLLEYLRTHDGVNMADLSFTLLNGRKHYPDYRLAIVAERQEELLSKLLAAQPRQAANFKESAIYILPDYVDGAEQWLTDYLSVGFKDTSAVETCQEIVELEANPLAACFAFHYAQAQLWMALGIKPQSTIGIGIGEAVSAVLTKRLTLAEGLEKALNVERVVLNQDKLRQFIEMQIAKGRNLFLNFFPGALGAAIKQIIGNLPDVRYFDCYNGERGRGLVETLASLYEAGFTINWSELFTGSRISLPVHPYQKKSYWFEVDYRKLHEFVNTAERTNQFEIPEIDLPVVNPAEIQSVERIEEMLTSIWKQRLGLAEIRRDADFIELGGDSLRGMMLMVDIRKYFQVELDIAYLLQYGTIAALAGLIWEKIQNGERVLSATGAPADGIDTELAGLSRQEIDRLNEVFGSLVEGLE